MWPQAARGCSQQCPLLQNLYAYKLGGCIYQHNPTGIFIFFPRPRSVSRANRHCSMEGIPTLPTYLGTSSRYPVKLKRLAMMIPVAMINRCAARHYLRFLIHWPQGIRHLMLMALFLTFAVPRTAFRIMTAPLHGWLFQVRQ